MDKLLQHPSAPWSLHDILATYHASDLHSRLQPHDIPLPTSHDTARIHALCHVLGLDLHHFNLSSRKHQHHYQPSYHEKILKSSDQLNYIEKRLNQRYQSLQQHTHELTQQMEEMMQSWSRYASEMRYKIQEMVTIMSQQDITMEQLRVWMIQHVTTWVHQNQEIATKVRAYQSHQTQVLTQLAAMSVDPTFQTT